MRPDARDPAGTDLFHPSLQAATPERPIWSARAGFLTSFFGGVYGAAVFGLLNAGRMRRLREDAWVYLLAAALWTGFLYWAAQHFDAPSAPSWLSSFGTPARTVRRAANGFGALLFGLQYLRQGKFYRAASMTGRAYPNPWPVALGSIAAAMVLSFGVVALARLS